MIRAEFVTEDNKFIGFSVKGHSGLRPSGEDILCASVSGMAMLVINTLQEVFKATLSLDIREEVPLLSADVLSVPSQNEIGAFGTIEGFWLQLSDLEKQYPGNLTVNVRHSQKGKKND